MADTDRQSEDSSPFLRPLGASGKSSSSLPLDAFKPVPFTGFDGEDPDPDPADTGDASPSVILDRNEIIHAKGAAEKTSQMASLKPVTSDKILKDLKQNLVDVESPLERRKRPRTESESDGGLKLAPFAESASSVEAEKRNPSASGQSSGSMIEKDPQASWAFVPQEAIPKELESSEFQDDLGHVEVKQEPQAAIGHVYANQPSEPIAAPVSPATQSPAPSPMANGHSPAPKANVAQTAQESTTVKGSGIEAKPAFFMSTTPLPAGKTVAGFLGVLSADILVPKDLILQNPAPYGELHRIKAGEDKLEKVKSEGLRELSLKAQRLGADAVVGITMQYGEFDTNVCLFLVTGTAVKLSG